MPRTSLDGLPFSDLEKYNLAKIKSMGRPVPSSGATGQAPVTGSTQCSDRQKREKRKGQVNYSPEFTTFNPTELETPFPLR